MYKGIKSFTKSFFYVYIWLILDTLHAYIMFGGNGMIKKLGTLFVSLAIFITMIQPVLADEDKESSIPLAKDVPSAILLEQSTGTIIFDKNAHEQLPPASMTKVMTMLLVMEALDEGTLKLDEMVRISERASSMGGSQVFLAAGEEMSVEDLIKAIAIASGNDASVALAERLAGSEEQFVNQMNEKVKDLGLENTTFKNASGLPAEGQISTAYDMAMISKELLRHENITQYTSIYEDFLRKGEENEFWLVNTNKLVRFYPGADGLKTGFTQEAKYCLAATANKDNMRVISVVMGAETAKKRNQSISEMFDYAYSQYGTTTLFEKGEKVQSLNMLHAKNDEIDVITSEPIRTLHAKGESEEEYDVTISMNDSISLPIQKGAKVGTMYIQKNGETIKESPLTVSENINKASYFSLFKRSLQQIIKK